jgi:hypothetical protein
MMLPKPLGSVWNPLFAQMFTAWAQSLATTGGATANMLKVPGQGLGGFGPQVSITIQYCTPADSWTETLLLVVSEVMAPMQVPPAVGHAPLNTQMELHGWPLTVMA